MLSAWENPLEKAHAAGKSTMKVPGATPGGTRGTSPRLVRPPCQPPCTILCTQAFARIHQLDTPSRGPPETPTYTLESADCAPGSKACHFETLSPLVPVQTTPPHTPLTVDHVATVGRWMASQEHWEDDKATAIPPASHEEKEANTAGATGGLEWSLPPPTLGHTRVSMAAKMPTVQPPAYGLCPESQSSLLSEHPAEAFPSVSTATVGPLRGARGAPYWT